MAKQQRTIVGENLTPTLLRELGGVDKFPRTPAGFQPDGNWTNKYRIWTCHGYRESSNENVGSLRITRRVDLKKTFILEVHQEIVQTDELTNVIEGTIKCRNDKLASPVEWKLSSRFTGPNSKIISELSSRNHGVATESVTSTTSDWALFEVVQRLAFDKRNSLKFDLLEGMSLSKLRHRLFYRGTYPMKTDGQSILLHCFGQLGSGILPYEYWLDDRHRLLAVISMNKAYILDQ
ncbi:MAG: hypothetical protein ACYSWW_04600 [Planctomycetota bacterium]|jgi:hypothetical protein